MSKQYVTIANRAALVEDVEWMRDAGESAVMACQRLGMCAATIARHMRRMDRRDLARYIDEAVRHG